MVVSFRAKLMLSHVLVAVATGGVAAAVVDWTLGRELEAQVDARLADQAEGVAQWLRRARHIERLAPRLSQVVGARVTIVDELGIAVGDSERDPDRPAGMDSEGAGEEIDEARAGDIGRATRYSAVAGGEVRYVARPGPGGQVVRLGLPLAEVQRTGEIVRGRILVAGGASLLVALGLALVMSRALSARVRVASAAAHRVGQGDYDVDLPFGPSDDIGLLGRTIVESARTLQRTDERRREFLANVAHELRTPVTSIRGYAQTLADPELAPDRRREFTRIIYRNAVRVGRLVDGLLTLERSRADTAPEIAPVDLESIARDVAASCAPELPEGAEVRVGIEAGVSARGDERAVEQILSNLLVNAFRYGASHVDITTTSTPEMVAVHVTDDGPGLADDELPHLFERFYRGVQAGDKSGSGLGLAISSELATAMGGRLVASRPEGGGARFSLELPA